MAQSWWRRKGRLVLFIIALPVLIVPIASALLSPETPLTKSILYGVIFSLFLAIGFRAAQATKALGLRFTIAIVIIAVFIGLLLGILSKLLL